MEDDVKLGKCCICEVEDETVRNPVFACLGYPGENRRIPVSELPPEHFDHDMSKHPEEAEAMAMAADFDEKEDDD